MTTRKIFLNQLAGGGLALALGACGGGDDSPAPAPAPGPAPAPPPPPAAPCNAFTFSANHRHSLVIARADLDSTVARTYNVQGTGDHGHTVTLSPAHLAQLKAGQTVSVTSTMDSGHTHQLGGGCT